MIAKGEIELKICPNCNGEGYVTFRIYPWDGTSYDEKPCKVCKKKGNLTEEEYEKLINPDPA